MSVATEPHPELEYLDEWIEGTDRAKEGAARREPHAAVGVLRNGRVQQAGQNDDCSEPGSYRDQQRDERAPVTKSQRVLHSEKVRGKPPHEDGDEENRRRHQGRRHCCDGNQDARRRRESGRRVVTADRYSHALVDYREVDRAQALERVRRARAVRTPVRTSSTEDPSFARVF